MNMITTIRRLETIIWMLTDEGATLRSQKEAAARVLTSTECRSTYLVRALKEAATKGRKAHFIATVRRALAAAKQWDNFSKIPAGEKVTGFSLWDFDNVTVTKCENNPALAFDENGDMYDSDAFNDFEVVKTEDQQDEVTVIKAGTFTETLGMYVTAALSLGVAIPISGDLISSELRAGCV